MSNVGATAKGRVNGGCRLGGQGTRTLDRLIHPCIAVGFDTIGTVGFWDNYTWTVVSMKQALQSIILVHAAKIKGRWYT